MDDDQEGSAMDDLPDEGRPLAHLLELAGAHVGAGRADPSQDVEHGGRHVPAVGHRDSLALGGSGDAVQYSKDQIRTYFKTKIRIK